jgi:hypothetical protein
MQVLSRIHPEWNLESVCGATSSASGRVNDPQIPLTRRHCNVLHRLKTQIDAQARICVQIGDTPAEKDYR